MQRRHRHIPVRGRFEVGRVRRRLDGPAEREPVIVIAAWIDVADDLQPAIVAETLADDAHALHRIGRAGGEVDVDQRPRGEWRVDQWPQHPLAPRRRGLERHAVAHALAAVDLAQRDRPDAAERTLHRRRDRARIGYVLGQVRAAVDARQDQVGRAILHDLGERHHHRIGRRARHRIALLAMLPHADRPRQRQRMARARLFLRGCHHPDIVGQCPGDRLQHLEAGRVIAVVVGQQDPHQRFGSNTVSPPRYGWSTVGTATEPSSCW